MKAYYMLQAVRLPKNHRMAHEKDRAIIGQRGRLCQRGEPKYFRTEQEAESFREDFLKRNGPEFDLEILKTTGPINIHSGKQLTEDYFIEHNYYIRVAVAPESLFIKRENLRPAYDSEELAVGKGNTMTRKGRQRWFQTQKDAELHLEKLKKSPAYLNYVFEVIAAF